MKLMTIEQVKFFPSGRLEFTCEGSSFQAAVDDMMASAAAEEILNQKREVDVKTQAAIVAFAVNQLHWRFGKKYTAHAIEE